MYRPSIFNPWTAIDVWLALNALLNGHLAVDLSARISSLAREATFLQVRSGGIEARRSFERDKKALKSSSPGRGENEKSSRWPKETFRLPLSNRFSSPLIRPSFSNRLSESITRSCLAFNSIASRSRAASCLESTERCNKLTSLSASSPLPSRFPSRFQPFSPSRYPTDLRSAKETGGERDSGSIPLAVTLKPPLGGRKEILIVAKLKGSQVEGALVLRAGQICLQNFTKRFYVRRGSKDARDIGRYERSHVELYEESSCGVFPTERPRSGPPHRGQ